MLAGLCKGAIRGVPVRALLAGMVLLGSRLAPVQSVSEGLRLERRVHRLWCVRCAFALSHLYCPVQSFHF